MKDNNIEQLRKKLDWYIYECPYDEFNEQEVFYIIDKLREYDDEYEKEISSSHFTFNLKLLQSKQKRQPNRRIIIATFSSIAIASSLFLAISLNNQSIAGLKIGLFNFIKNDNTGITFFTSPDKPKDLKVTYTENEIPEQYTDMIWRPSVLPKYELSYIETLDSDLAKVCYVSKADADYIVLFYLVELNLDNDVALIGKLNYKGIEISCFSLNGDKHLKIYYFTFQYQDIEYCIESNNFKDLNIASTNFIDFLIQK